MFRYSLIIILVGITGYGLVEAWPLLAGPTLTVVSPTEGTPYPSGIVSVSGVAKRAAEFTVNGAPALHGEDGSFAMMLTFPRGGSILTVAATDRFGRTVSVTRTVFVP